MKLIIIICLFITSTSYARINAIYNNDKVEITWTNPKDIKVDYFTIQRSKNGKHFKDLIKIDGNKMGYNINEYREIDSKPYRLKGYYRLKQVDINGKIHYSNIILTKKDKKLKNYTANNILVVLANNEKKEFITKVDLVFENKHLIITSSDINLPTGKYMVIATSDDTIYGKEIFFEGNYSNSLQSQHTKLQ